MGLSLALAFSPGTCTGQFPVTQMSPGWERRQMRRGSWRPESYLGSSHCPPLLAPGGWVFLIPESKSFPIFG